ncbi:MAG TPA: hypothetical protein VMH33_11635 [Solirubrobacterales bacterium]|nr:hypothetical protein [Solirubrobacterales bacterium]
MLGPGRYLLGVAELIWLIGFAWLGAQRVRRRWLSELSGEAGFLASAIVAIALLIWVAELLGTVSLFKPVPYLVGVAVVGLGLRFAVADGPEPEEPSSDFGRPSLLATVIALVIAGIAIGHFVSGVKLRLGTGMTGFDSTWYHGPFAAGFYQSGNTFDLHFIAPQFLAWFYPANSEVLHAVGMLAFSRDLMSPLLNLGWLLGCLLACWCIGRPFRVAPWSLGLGAVALSVPALADQAGEARNDIVGIFFLLAAVAVALNAAAPPGRIRRPDRQAGRSADSPGGPLEVAGLSIGALLVVGLAVGLAAGTKLNFLLPAAVLVFGLVAVAPTGRRWWTLLCAGGMALAGGGYWYLRNLIHTGNPLPWFKHLGPIDLPAPGQALGGRETHTVLSYLTDGTVWSEWFLPGFHGALWIVWPLLGAAALAGLLLAISQRHRWGGVLMVAGLVGLAAAISWLVSPTSASGPEGMPRGFESGLRYLTPALILGLALLPTTSFLRDRLHLPPHRGGNRGHGVEEERLPRRWVAGIVAGAVILAVIVGYPVERHYLRNRYRDPSFTTPGLDAAFAWARDVSGARIGTTSTRQYPLYGTDLSNRVAYIGVRGPHGGFEEPRGCRQFLRLVNEGEYDYVVASRDRIEAGKPLYPPSARWIGGPNAHVVLRKPPTVVFRVTGPLDPSRCP